MHPFTGFRILFFLTAVFFDRIAATIFKIVMFPMLDQDNFTDPGTPQYLHGIRKNPRP